MNHYCSDYWKLYHEWDEILSAGGDAKEICARIEAHFATCQECERELRQVAGGNSANCEGE